MRSAFQCVSLAGLIVAGTVSAGVVSVPFEKRYLDNDLAPSLLRRDGTINLDALNNITGGGYYAQLSIGTPPQNLSFHLDTGSSDTWVNSNEADLCTNRYVQKTVGQFCSKQFDPSRSSSYEPLPNAPFNITYLDGRHIQGRYFKDTVTINGAEIKDQQLGLALKSVHGTGLMGLGFSQSVATTSKYPTVVDNMVSQKIIPVPAFSLYLNDLQTSKGTILFGGVDTDKFHGGLATLPLQPLPSSVSSSRAIKTYNVQLNGFTASGVQVPSVNAGAILDSGSTITLLPENVVQPIWNHFGVQRIPGLSIPFIDCAKANSKGVSFDFHFTNKTIKVPLDEVVINNLASVQDELLQDQQLKKYFGGWSGVCMFGFSSTSNYGILASDFVLLGDTFLRSAYVVYDLQNKQIGIAQATLNATTSSIVEFQAGSESIPGPVATGDDSDNSADSGSSNTSTESAGAMPYPAFSIAVAGTMLTTLSMMVNAL